jgi:threonine dehydrogenase-like Zn-dependent dehydrogenase
MQSLWGKAPFQFEMRDLPTPEPGPGEVLVQVTACGICGTDLHFLRYNADWTPLGHEVVGEIAAVGPGVSRWRGGEAVIVENHTGCGVCDQCKNGRALYCRDLTTYMNDRAGFADYLRVRADMVQSYDAGALAPHQAALAEPLTVALDLLQRADPDLNDEVAVFGPGAIGLMVVRLARLRGARRIFLTGPNRATPRSCHRLAVGQQMGADVVLAEAEDDIVAAIRTAVPGGVDRVFVTAPPRTLPLAFKIARFGAIVGLIGIEFGPGGEVTFDVNAFHFKKLQLRASHAIPNHYFPMATDLLARRTVNPDLLVSHTFRLNAYREAFATLTDPQQTAVKVALIP